MKYETVKKLAQKVDWEGGILEALKYGIRSSQIADPKIKALWEELEKIQHVVDQLEIELDLGNFE